MIFRDTKTNKITWAITIDHLGDQHTCTPDQKKEIQAQCPHHFKLYDGDGILYYEGYSADCDSEDAFEPLDWGMADSGCTTIKYRNPQTGKYEFL